MTFPSSSYSNLLLLLLRCLATLGQLVVADARHYQVVVLVESCGASG